MPRANRCFLPDHVWHITHRCHKREFLLKFARDRRRWLYWLFEAKRRFGLRVLNYVVTANHIHLLVRDQGNGEIARSMQLVAGRTGQEYNQRKGRKGAFWEDRYHATAVDTADHLVRCLVYIDLNMVRAGIVTHPEEWLAGGYWEIQNPPKRYRIIDMALLMGLLDLADLAGLQSSRAQWVAEALKTGGLHREGYWSESLAVGSPAFVEGAKEQLGIRARFRNVGQEGGVHYLKEPAVAYGSDLGPGMDVLSTENSLLLE